MSRAIEVKAEPEEPQGWYGYYRTGRGWVRVRTPGPSGVPIVYDSVEEAEAGANRAALNNGETQ